MLRENLIIEIAKKFNQFFSSAFRQIVDVRALKNVVLTATIDSFLIKSLVSRTFPFIAWLFVIFLFLYSLFLIRATDGEQTHKLSEFWRSAWDPSFIDSTMLNRVFVVRDFSLPNLSGTSFMHTRDDNSRLLDASGNCFRTAMKFMLFSSEWRITKMNLSRPSRKPQIHANPVDEVLDFMRLCRFHWLNYETQTQKVKNNFSWIRLWSLRLTQRFHLEIEK